MKTMMVSLIAGILVLTGFTVKKEEDKLKGIWMGYYKSEGMKEKIVIKFCTEDRIEFYAGGVWDEETCAGSYQLLGDSISFKYKTPEGKEFEMQGQISQRKNYVDGVWKSKESQGSFFIERQEVEEKVVSVGKRALSTVR